MRLLTRPGGDDGRPKHLADELLTQLEPGKEGRWRVARRDAASRQRGRDPAAPPGLAGPLTDRELEVLRLLAAGRSNQRIGHDLVVALDTVKGT
jgi:ATP/maltotriose-dependent transcriptional regulator MalT